MDKNLLKHLPSWQSIATMAKWSNDSAMTRTGWIATFVRTIRNKDVSSFHRMDNLDAACKSHGNAPKWRALCVLHSRRPQCVRVKDHQSFAFYASNDKYFVGSIERKWCRGSMKWIRTFRDKLTSFRGMNFILKSVFASAIITRLLNSFDILK